MLIVHGLGGQCSGGGTCQTHIDQSDCDVFLCWDGCGAGPVDDASPIVTPFLIFEVDDGLGATLTHG
jgi:hypothetical protein